VTPSFIAAVRATNRKIRRVVLTQSHFEEMLRDLIRHPDCPVKGIRLTISSERPYADFVISTRPSPSNNGPFLQVVRLGDNRRSKCKIELWQTSRLRNQKELMKGLRNVVRSYWKPHLRSLPADLVDLQQNILVPKMLENTLQVYRKNGISFSILYCDLDNFKDINLQYGQEEGNRVIKEVGAIIESLVAEMAVPLHFGGDEFVIIVPVLAPFEVRRLASKIANKIQAHDFHLNGRKQSISVGIAIGEGSKQLNQMTRESYESAVRLKSAKYQDKQQGS
jgi:diguanylate cyclase (GGDEF)-like protein